MKAVIKTGGKQYYVEEGNVIYIEKLDGNVGDKVIFDEVLMLGSTLGNPTIKSVVNDILFLIFLISSILLFFKYKPNTTSTRKKQGHRQPYTKVEIKKIG